jgi:CheY-like chemotaxis protein
LDQPFHKTIVVSEDINRAFGSEDCYLRRPAFRLHVGRTGDEVLALARGVLPDAILINYHLVGSRGDEVCHALRSDPGTRAIRTLIVGPAQSHEIADACRASGCDEYLGSPSHPNALLERLAAHLGIQFRLHARLPAVVSISSGRIISEFLGYSKDISEGGILVESSVKADLGRRLHLRLYLGDDERPVALSATVLHVRPEPEEDRYLLGMKFQSIEPAIAARIRRYIDTRTRQG